MLSIKASEFIYIIFYHFLQKVILYVNILLVQR